MKKYLSVLILLTAAIVWGLGFVMQKIAASLEPFTMCAIRSFLAFVFLIFAAMGFDRLSKNGRRIISKRGIDFKKSELIGGVVCGAILFVAANLQQIGLGEGTDAGKASFITALYMVIVPIYTLLFKKKLRPIVPICVGIAVFGFYLLCIDDGFSIAPSDLFVFFCAFVFAMQIIAIDVSLSYEGTDGVRLSCIQFLTAGVLSLICALIFERGQQISDLFTYLPQLIYLGIFSSGVGYTFQILGQKHTPPAVASIVLSLESVFGALAGAIVLQEKMSSREYIGCAVIFLAVILSQINFEALFGKLRAKKSGQEPENESEICCKSNFDT